MIRERVLPFLIFAFYRLLSLTWRKSVAEPQSLKDTLAQGKTVIFAHWHGDELAITYLVPRYRLATMTSTSKDGELMDRVIHHLGGATSRGSSTRGGIQALKGLVRLCRSGHCASVAVDGPKGPIHRIKPGVFQLSHLTQAPIYAVGVAARPTFVFRKSWNQTYLPYPFSRLAVVFSEALPPPAPEADIKSSEISEPLYLRLAEARERAAKLIAQT